MKYRYLGRSGLLVSRICLGTMTFGMKDWGCDEATSIAITKRFIECGGNFIDTADMYSAGVSEQHVAKAIAGHQRDDLVLATKCWFRMGKTPNNKGLSRKHIFEACEASLRRLNTEYIDLYQLHGPDPYTPIEETMRAMDDLVRDGKVRYVGCSNFYGWQIVKANAIAEAHGHSKLISGQRGRQNACAGFAKLATGRQTRLSRNRWLPARRPNRRRVSSWRLGHDGGTAPIVDQLCEVSARIPC